MTTAHILGVDHAAEALGVSKELLIERLAAGALPEAINRHGSWAVPTEALGAIASREGWSLSIDASSTRALIEVPESEAALSLPATSEVSIPPRPTGEVPVFPGPTMPPVAFRTSGTPDDDIDDTAGFDARESAIAALPLLTSTNISTAPQATPETTDSLEDQAAAPLLTSTSEEPPLARRASDTPAAPQATPMATPDTQVATAADPGDSRDRIRRLLHNFESAEAEIKRLRAELTATEQAVAVTERDKAVAEARLDELRRRSEQDRHELTMMASRVKALESDRELAIESMDRRSKRRYVKRRKAARVAPSTPPAPPGAHSASAAPLASATIGPPLKSTGT